MTKKRFEEKSNFAKREFVPESVWPLFSWSHFGYDSYEEGLNSQTDITSPEIALYTPEDDDLEDDDKDSRNPFTYADVVRLIQDGVVDNLVAPKDASIGISVNDQNALLEFLWETRQAWAKCVDRLSVNRIAETKTFRYPLTDGT